LTLRRETLQKVLEFQPTLLLPFAHVQKELGDRDGSA
jgi:hypothetical protein